MFSKNLQTYFFGTMNLRSKERPAQYIATRQERHNQFLIKLLVLNFQGIFLVTAGSKENSNYVTHIQTKIIGIDQSLESVNNQNIVHYESTMTITRSLKTKKYKHTGTFRGEYLGFIEVLLNVSGDGLVLFSLVKEVKQVGRYFCQLVSFVFQR